MPTEADSEPERGIGAEAAPQHLLIKGRDQIRDRIAELAEQARREVVIFAPQLDPHFFNTARLGRALASFAARHRHNLARLLVEDGGQALRDNDRVADLGRRLGDLIHIRQVSEEYVGHREMFVIVDRTACLHQLDTDKPECLAGARLGRDTVELVERFDEWWERSIELPGRSTAGL